MTDRSPPISHSLSVTWRTPGSTHLDDGEGPVCGVVAGLELREPVARLSWAGPTLVQEDLDVPLHQRAARRGPRRVGGHGGRGGWIPRRLLHCRRGGAIPSALIGILSGRRPGRAEPAPGAGAPGRPPPRAATQPPGAPSASRAAQPSAHRGRPQGPGQPCRRHDNQTRSPPQRVTVCRELPALRAS